MPNRLASESSPYLLEHADNPVDWRPWSDEAFEEAHRQGKLVFLSVGYSACHWCHVMRRESFEDPSIASVMNQHFINVKLDREERPDIDHQFQLAFQLMNRRAGGWPLSIFLTPDRRPVFAGTYFPKEPRYGMHSFHDVLTSVAEAYANRQEELVVSAQRLTEHLRSIGEGARGMQLQDDKTLLLPDDEVLDELLSEGDRTYGGFGTAPKFPNETTLQLLLTLAGRADHSEALQFLELTLDQMVAGGIYDQLGGGIHRYSVDRVWLAPHFEKMLYNQAMLVPVLVEAYQLLRKERYLGVAEEILTYVGREMVDPMGGFYSAQNADSEGVEGKFFVWSLEEVLEVLGEEDGRLFAARYDITEAGNWEATNILRINRSVRKLTELFGLREEEVEERLARAKDKLFQHRSKRVAPSTDTKVMTGWTALMARAFVQVARLRGRHTHAGQRWWEIGKNAVDFLVGTMWWDDQLYRVFSDGRVKKTIHAFLDDYQYFVAALLDVYEGTLDLSYLRLAEQLFDKAHTYFWDDKSGGYYYSSSQHDTPVGRFKGTYDQPLTSPNALAIANAVRLGVFREGRAEELDRLARQALEAFAPEVRQSSATGVATYLLSSLLYHLRPTELTLLLPEGLEGEDFRNQLAHEWVPFRVLTEVGPDDRTEGHGWLEGKELVGDQPTAYVCVNFTCSRPLTKLADVRSYLTSQPSSPPES